MKNKNDLVLALLYAPGYKGKFNEPIQGITRLMKLLFLINKSTELGIKLEFEPFKMGPYSSDVYSALEFFQNYPSPESPLIVVDKDTDEDAGARKLENKKFVDDAISDEPDGFYAANSIFKLSELGELLAQKLWNDEVDELTKSNIANIKKQFGVMSLNSLLRYVYDRYPEMTENSQIKDSIYGK